VQKEVCENSVSCDTRRKKEASSDGGNEIRKR
jgi:hypothetical protein